MSVSALSIERVHANTSADVTVTVDGTKVF